jgi:hypothetical protein
MRTVDALAVALAFAGAVALILGDLAFADVNDLRGFFLLAAGAVALGGASRMSRPGASA